MLLDRSFESAVYQSCLCFQLRVLHFIASFHESHAWHILIRIDAGTEVAYELIAEPIQEPQAGETRAEVAVEPGPEVANPADWQGKPWCITLSFSISIFVIYLLCI